MTIGEKNILAATLNFLLDKDLISNEALNEAFFKLDLPQECKDFCEDNAFYENNALNFIDGAQYIQEEEQNGF